MTGARTARMHGRVAAFATFFLISLTLYALIHYSLLLSLREILPLPHLTGTIVTLWALSIAAFFVARIHHDPVTNAFYRIGVTWMGLAFLLFIVLFPLTIVTILFGGTLSPLVLLPIAALIAVSVVLALATRVRTVDVPLSRLPAERDGFRIVQLTDLHIGEVYGPSFLRRVVRKANALDADVIVITGDVFDGGGKPYAGMIAPLRDLRSRHGVYYVRGNHDVYEGVERTDALVRDAGITILDDAMTSIEGLALVGLSYPSDLRDPKRDTLKRLAAEARRRFPKLPHILLRHEPRDPDLAAELGFDLMLSGHTHNGQLWPLSYLVRLAYPFRVGLHQLQHMTLYIGPGIGTWGPPLRLGSRSEITLLRLRHLE